MTTKIAESYKGHQEGSRKGRVHQLFDTQGEDAAWTLGRKLKLKKSSLRSWFGEWRRAKKPASKKPADRAAA
jgi:hypothetical protein